MSQAGLINVIDTNPTIPIYFDADTGTAVALMNVIRILGDASSIATSASGNTITISYSAAPAEYTNVTNAMSPYTATLTDYYISVDATAGPVIINLPDSPTAGRQFVIKDRLGQAGTNTITVKSLSGVTTIDGQASYVFVDNYESLECIYHSSNYEIF